MPVAQPIQVMQKTRRGGHGGAGLFSFKLEFLDDFAINLDASAMLDAVSTALLVHHRSAITKGAKASGGPQTSLAPQGTQGKLARAGDRPRARGFRGQKSTLPFPDWIQRTAIQETLRQTASQRKKQTVSVVAKCQIKPNALHSGFVARDSEKSGVEYFYVEGDARAVIDRTLDAILGKMLEGQPVQWTKTELVAKNASGPAKLTTRTTS